MRHLNLWLLSLVVLGVLIAPFSVMLYANDNRELAQTADRERSILEEPEIKAALALAKKGKKSSVKDNAEKSNSATNKISQLPLTTAKSAETDANDKVSSKQSEQGIPSSTVTRVILGKGTYDLPWSKIDDKKMYDLDDEEVRSLCTYAMCRISRSFIGNTLTVLNGEREIVFTPDMPTMRVDGEELPIAGVGTFVARGDKRYVDASLLWYLLGMHATEVGGNIVLKQSLYAPELVEERGRRLVFKATGPLEWNHDYDDKDGWIINFTNSYWELGQNSYDLDDIHLDIDNIPDGGVVAKLSCMESWVPAFHKSANLNEAIVTFMPAYPRVEYDSNLYSLKMRESEHNGGIIDFKVSDGFWYRWVYDSDTRILRLDLAGVRSELNGELGLHLEGLKRCKMLDVGNNELAVSRFQAIVEKGYQIEVVPSEANEGEIALCVVPGDFAESVYDEGYTRGYEFKRGIIVIDPGHGGGDSGCRNVALGLMEKNITLDVAWRLRNALEANGWMVIMTREDDRDVSWLHSPDKVELQARCDVANDNNATLFISLHCDASESKSLSGTTIYWYNRADRELAEFLDGAISSLGVRNIGLRQNNFYVLRNTMMPSVLVEMAFLSNMNDGRLLGREDFRQKIAENLAEAIESMFQ